MFSFSQQPKRMGKAISANWSDVLIFMGLGELGWGLWLKSPWLSLTVTGGLLFLLGVRGSMAQARAMRKTN